MDKLRIFKALLPSVIIYGIAMWIVDYLHKDISISIGLIVGTLSALIILMIVPDEEEEWNKTNM